MQALKSIGWIAWSLLMLVYWQGYFSSALENVCGSGVLSLLGVNLPLSVHLTYYEQSFTSGWTQPVRRHRVYWLQWFAESETVRESPLPSRSKPLCPGCSLGSARRADSASIAPSPTCSRRGFQFSVRRCRNAWRPLRLLSSWSHELAWCSLEGKTGIIIEEGDCFIHGLSNWRAIKMQPLQSSHVVKTSEISQGIEDMTSAWCDVTKPQLITNMVRLEPIWSVTSIKAKNELKGNEMKVLEFLGK